jgi:hypothetical protein
MAKRFRVKTVAGFFYTSAGYGRFAKQQLEGHVYCEEHAQELKDMFDRIQADEGDITFDAELVAAPQNMPCQNKECKKSSTTPP